MNHDFPTNERGQVLTRTGLAIGRSYVPPPANRQSRDAELIQTALLRGQAPRLVERVMDVFEGSGGPLLVSILVIGAVLGLAKAFH
jgi:hypothetical protein